MSHRLTLLVFVATLVMCPVQLLAQSPSEESSQIVLADCHVHLLDFLQNGDFYADGRFVRGGTTNQALQPRSRIEALLHMMDYAHVSEAQVLGMPFVK